MKHISALILCVLTITPLYAVAQEAVPRHDVFAATQAILDLTTAIPDAFKPIEKDMRAYRVVRQQYKEQAEKAFQSAFDILTQTPKTQADYATIAKNFDAQSRQLSLMLLQRKEHVKRMQSTPKGKALWQAIVEVRPEYNDVLTASFENRYHDAIVKLLKALHGMYDAMAKAPNTVVHANGQFLFTTPQETYTYLRALTEFREAAKEIAISERDKFAFMARQPGILALHGNEYVADLEYKEKIKTLEIEQWARTTSTESVGYSPLSFFLRLNRAVQGDDTLFVLRQRTGTIRTELAHTAAFAQSDFTSLAPLQSATARNQKIIATFETYEKAVRDMKVRMGREIAEQYNIHRAVYNASDLEYSAFYGAEIITPYVHALLEYQSRVYKTAEACVKTTGKKKCTLKVKDDISLTVSDKKIQKELDALKAAFLKRYGVTYELWKGKPLP